MKRIKLVVSLLLILCITATMCACTSQKPATNISTNNDKGSGINWETEEKVENSNNAEADNSSTNGGYEGNNDKNTTNNTNNNFNMGDIFDSFGDFGDFGDFDDFGSIDSDLDFGFGNTSSIEVNASLIKQLTNLKKGKIPASQEDYNESNTVAWYNELENIIIYDCRTNKTEFEFNGTIDREKDGNDYVYKLTIKYSNGKEYEKEFDGYGNLFIQISDIGHISLSGLVAGDFENYIEK